MHCFVGRGGGFERGHEPAPLGVSKVHGHDELLQRPAGSDLRRVAEHHDRGGAPVHDFASGRRDHYGIGILVQDQTLVVCRHLDAVPRDSGVLPCLRSVGKTIRLL